MENSSYGLIQLFHDGGFFMYPLLLCSLLGIGVIIAKSYVLWAARRDTQRVLSEVDELAREGKLDEAITAAERTPGPVAAILLSGLSRFKDETSTGVDVERAVGSTGKIELGFLERGLVVLATVATVAPLLGFLGTVWGMIEAFGAIEAAGQVEATLVASGIKIALITTATGLLIAIPINLGYNYFVTRIDQLILDMEKGTNTISQLLWDVYGKEAPAAAGMATAPGATATRERPLGFDAQTEIVPDKDELKSSEHRTLD